MLDQIGTFLRLVWAEWSSRVTGSISAFLVLAGLCISIAGTFGAKIPSESILQLVTWALAALFGAQAAFSIWAREHQARIEVERKLAEKTTPNFTVSFDQERGGIVNAVDQTKIEMPGTYGGTIFRPGPSYNASCLRILIKTKSDVPVKRCQAFILSLEKQAQPDEAFIYVELPQRIPLQTGPFEVLPNIPYPVDFMKASDQNNKLVRTGEWPNVLARAFDDLATYRFTIAVNGDGITAKPIKVDVVWRGQWDTISASQVHET